MVKALLGLSFEYPTDLFDASTVAVWGGRFTDVLTAAVRAPHTGPEELVS